MKEDSGGLAHRTASVGSGLKGFKSAHEVSRGGQRGGDHPLFVWLTQTVPASSADETRRH